MGDILAQPIRLRYGAGHSEDRAEDRDEKPGLLETGFRGLATVLSAPRSEGLRPIADNKKIDLWETTKTGFLYGCFIGGAVGAYATNRLLAKDINQIPGYEGDPLRNTGNFLMTGSNILATTFYVGFVPDMEPLTATVHDLFYGMSAAAVGVWALNGDGGGPALELSLDSFANIAAHRLHRHLGRGWGSLAQMALGLVSIGASRLVPELEAKEFSGQASIAPEDVPLYGGEENSPGDSWSARRFPNLHDHLILLGIDHLLVGACSGLYRLIFGGDSDKTKETAFLHVESRPGGVLIQVFIPWG